MALYGNPNNLQGGTLGTLLQGGSSQTTSTATAPVGVKAKSNTTGLLKPTNTIPTSQIAPKDLSGTYANVNGTIYNKQSQTKFAKPEDFYKDAGVSNFNNLKFDTNYTPTGKETVYGQPLIDTKENTTEPTTSTTTSTTQTSIPQSSTTPYTPPNQGTTGVSQGGIIGNLLLTANKENPEVTKARSDLKTLTDEYAQATNDIMSRPEGLTQQTGQQGLLNQLFATKQSAAQTALQSALTSQGQQITATTNAGNLNAPVFTTPGQVQVTPSQPTPGATTSGAANLNSLIGTRQIPGQTQTEYFDKTTGQGFANPQALADFVNKQIPNANANAQNVFQILDQLAKGGSNIVGGNSTLNPIANIPSLAQQVVNGTLSYSDALAQGGTVPNFAGALTQAITQISPGFNFNTAQGNATAQTTVTAQQQQQVATWQSALQQGQNLQSQLIDLITAFNLNPSDVNAVNTGLQKIAANVSDPRYKALQNYVNDVANTYAQVLTPAGGSQTDTTRSIAASMLDSTASGKSLLAVMSSLDQAAKAKIAGVQTAPNTNTSSVKSNSPFGWNP